VGRRYIAADDALSIATCTLALCVLSIFSKATRKPWLSTTAMATGQLFLRASACPLAIAFFACSRLMSAPYCGICASDGWAMPPATPIALPAAAAVSMKLRRVTWSMVSSSSPPAGTQADVGGSVQLELSTGKDLPASRCGQFRTGEKSNR
jgi:hypothetical protein